MSLKDEHQYDDIINMPHHTSKKYPRMAAIDRAAQFSPFAALTGYEEALEEIIKFLEEAGIHLEENYKVYTCYLDYETLREQEAYYDMDGNKLDIGSKWEWSEADNAYLFYIHQAYCNLEDYKCGKKWKPKVEIYNAQIKVIYTSDGIAEMVVRDLSTYSMGSTKEQLLDINAKLNNIKAPKK